MREKPILTRTYRMFRTKALFENNLMFPVLSCIYL
jgi:hypothetical protein